MRKINVIEYTNSSLITVLPIPYNLVLDENIQLFLPQLALLEILEKSLMKEILVRYFR